MRNNTKTASITEKQKQILSDDSKFAIIEGYKTARTNLMFSLAAKDSKIVAVTSWSKSDGKSTAVSNLSVSLSKLGSKILLIDADLRKPNVHNLLKLNNKIGLSDVLGKFHSFSDAVQKDVLPCLDVLTSGAIPPNPSELLASKQLKALVAEIKELYDYILFDTPPIGIVTDALMIKDDIAGYVAIIRESVSSHGDIEKLLQNISLAGSSVLGFIKSGCTPHDGKSRYGKKYGYEYYKYY